MPEEIKIPFSFPVDPNIGQLLSSIKKLKEETQSLGEEMTNLPIDELRAKQQQWISVLGNISIETQKANQSNKQQQSLLSKNIDLVDDIIKKIQTNIDLQKLLTAEGDKQQKMLDSLNKETLKAVSSLDALNQKVSEGTKLTSAETNAKIRYGEVVTKNTNILTLFSSAVKDSVVNLKNSSEQTQAAMGHIAQLETLVKNLTLAYKDLDESEIQNADTIKYYSDTISNLNTQLDFYKTQISGTLDAEGALQKVREQNIIIANKTNALGEVDIDIKAKQIIANNELNASIQERVKLLSGVYEKEIADAGEKEKAELLLYTEKVNRENELLYEQYEKEKEINQKKIADTEARSQKQVRLEELKYSNMWLAAERSYGKTWNSAEGAYNKIEDKVEKTGKKAIFSLENIAETAERMGLRTALSFIYWTVLIEGAMQLYQWWSKVDDATQSAMDSLKGYSEGVKTLLGDLSNSVWQNSANKIFKASELKNQISIMQDSSVGIGGRYRAYKKATGYAPGIFDDMNVDKFEKNGVSDSQKKNMNRYIQLQEDIETARKNQENVIKKIEEGKQTENILKQQLRDYEEGNNALLTGGVRYRDLSEDKKEAFIEALIKKGVVGGAGILADKPSTLSSQIATIRSQRDFMENPIKGSNLDFESVANNAELEQAKLQGDVKHPKGSHPKNHELDRRLQEEEEDYKVRQDLSKKDFEESGRSFNDRKELYEEENKNAKEHYDKALEIIKDYGAKSGKTKEEIHALELKYKDENVKEFKDREKNMKDDLIAFKKYNDENAKILEDTNQKILKSSEDARRRFESLQQSDRKNKGNETKAKRWNAVGAFLGTDGSTPYQDYQDDLSEIDDQIKTKKNDLNTSAGKVRDLQGKTFASDNKVFEEGNVPEKNRTQEQSIQYREDLEQNKKYHEQLSDANKQFDEDAKNLKTLQSDKSVKIDLHDKETKIAIANEVFSATEKIANNSFNAQKKRLQTQMDNVKSLADFEMTLAGNNSAAKLKIARELHDKSLALKRKEAQVDKEQAIFNIILSTASGIAKAWSLGPIAGAILSAVVAAVGLSELAVVTSAPLPAYKSGRKGGKSEVARINEDGFEIVEGKDGGMKLLGKGKDAVVKLNEGDTVHTHIESLDILQNTLLKGTGVFIQKEILDRKDRMQSYREGLSKSDMKDVMEDALRKMPKPEIIIPADHIILGLQSQRSRNGIKG